MLVASPRRPLVAQATLTALLAVASAGARAETHVVELAPDHYLAVVTGMPDLDQRRGTAAWGPERNRGRMYCGPTAAADILSYLVQEGYPGVDAPAVDFEPTVLAGLSGAALFQALWDNGLAQAAADTFIAELADEMGTGAFNQSDYDALSASARAAYGLPADPEDYTPGTGYSDIIRAIADRTPITYRVWSQGGKGCGEASRDTVVPRHLFEALRDGHLVILHIGNYVATSGGEYDRKGGHYVVVTSVLADGEGRYRAGYRDPWTEIAVYPEPIDTEGLEGAELREAWVHNTTPIDQYLFQSAFGTEASDLARRRVCADGCCRVRWAMLDKANYFVDGMIVVAPGAP